MFSSALKSFSSNITQNYVISTNPTSIAGAWKLFDAKSKKTGKNASVFVFDRKSLESNNGSFDGSRSSTATRRRVFDEVVERLKKEASALARLRHPNILELAEPVEETRGGGLMFATEPITATLASILREQDNKEGGRSRTTRFRKDEDGEQKEVELDELEIQKGLLQIAKGLEFLHESAGLVHGNLTPDAIYINSKSDWKISALAFAGPPDNSNSTAPSTAPPIALSELLHYDPRLPKALQLDINYSSPDFVMDTTVSTGADMFSLGLIMIALYNSPHESPLKANSNTSTYKRIFSSSSTVPSTSNNFLSSKALPAELKSDVLPRLITRRPAQRMSAREFQESSFFDNILVNTIRFLDALPGKSPNEKTQFLRGLPRVLEQFPKNVLQKKVLPALLEETKDRDLLPLIMTDTFKIIQLLPSPQRAVSDRVLPKLQELFPPITSKSTPQERDNAKEAGLAVVLENISLMADTCSGKEFKDYMLPIIILGLESPTHSLVDKSLRCLTTILKVLDFSTIKNELFPVVASVFSRTSSLAIKIRGLEAFVVLCGGSSENETIEDASSTSKSVILDKYTVQEKIVPLMKAIKTKEPAVMMAALAVFKQIGNIADTEFLAIEVLPILWAFSLGPLLNMQQFQQYMDTIKSTSSRIESEQTRKLRALAAESVNNNETRSVSSNDLMSLPNDGPFSPGSNVGEDDFARLVLGKPGSSTSTFATSSSMTASPAVTAQNKPSASSTKPIHDFGWSTNTPSLQPQNSSSRAITPDFTGTSLSSFPIMSPGNSMSGNRALAQPSMSASPFQNTSNTNASNPMAAMTPQSATSMQAPNYNTWAMSNSSPQNTSAAGWTLPPPPVGSSAGFGGMQMNSMVQRPNSNAGMGGMNTTGTSGSNPANAAWVQQPLEPLGRQQDPRSSGHQPGKTGLDKYESLI